MAYKDDILGRRGNYLPFEAANKAGILDDLLLGLLLGPQVGKGVDDDTEDEVEHDDNDDEVEEHVVDYPREKIYFLFTSCGNYYFTQCLLHKLK